MINISNIYFSKLFLTQCLINALFHNLVPKCCKFFLKMEMVRDVTKYKYASQIIDKKKSETENRYQ